MRYHKFTIFNHNRYVLQCYYNNYRDALRPYYQVLTNSLTKSKKGLPLPRAIYAYDLRYDVSCFVGNKKKEK